MKKLVLATVLLLGLSAMAMAQDVPMAEVFGGYSFYRCNIGAAATCNYDGWNAAVDFNVNKNWGAVMDISGQYGYQTNVNGYTWFDQKSHNIMFGPRFVMRHEKVSPFVQVLMGINHVNPEKAFMVQNNFAVAVGGGVDVSVTKRISIRPIQLDYFKTRVVNGNGFTNNLRFSSGFVFKFGKR
jgi:opacity protein-like surface antigen